MNMERAAEEEGDGDAAQSTRLAEEEDNDELADDEGVPLEATHACSSSLSSSSSSLDTPGSSVSSSSEWSGQASASTTAPRPYKATRDRRKECIAFFQQELGQKNFTVIERTPHKLRELLADAVRAYVPCFSRASSLLRPPNAPVTRIGRFGSRPSFSSTLARAAKQMANARATVFGRPPSRAPISRRFSFCAAPLTRAGHALRTCGNRRTTWAVTRVAFDLSLNRTISTFGPPLRALTFCHLSS